MLELILGRLQCASGAPPILLATIFHLGFLSSSETIFPRGVWGADRVGEWVIIVQIDSDYCSYECRIWLGLGLLAYLAKLSIDVV